MIIKKFEGKTEDEAVALAKKELGNGVVIMNVRNAGKKGLLSFFRRPRVEVTVALEDEKERMPFRPVTPIKPLKSAISQEKPSAAPVRKTEGSRVDIIADEEIDPGKLYQDEKREDKKGPDQPERKTGRDIPGDRLLEEKLDNLQSFIERQLARENEGTEITADDKQVSCLKLIYNTLIDNEVSEKYANEIVDEVGEAGGRDVDLDFILSNVYQKMILKFGRHPELSPAQNGAKAVFFIGPTGVGKTTTIAKIASILHVNEKKKIALLTADTYRVGAAEQLKTYAGILGVPFRVIYSTDEMTESLQDFSQYDYILVDTAGHSHKNDELKTNMIRFIDCIKDDMEKEVFLVVSATTKYRDLVNIVDAYSEFEGYKLIFTKLDETSAFGNLYNIKRYTGADISYVTCGQSVPDDIEPFSPQSTVKQLLGGK
ncbi:MAG: flagellar biosynthesis protein FlhF [Lachnospiraceae bacterium]|nr:flagellar biosynthesis protein FlhF [Lachnospiraceae bacterium]